MSGDRGAPRRWPRALPGGAGRVRGGPIPAGKETLTGRLARARTGPTVRVALTVLPWLLAVAGCAGAPSTFDPRGSPADLQSVLAWILTLAGSAVLLLVTALLVYPAWAARREPPGGPTRPGVPETDDRTVRLRRRFVVGGGVASGIVLVGVFALTVVDLVALGEPEEGPDLTIEVTGHRWWWEARYPSPEGVDAITANEIHIPVGRTVRVEVRTADVIHSFWVPQLAGKIDLMPGKPNATWLRAEEPGIYHGQCAEFCGAQHANMMFLVVAERPEEFRAWLERQVAPAREPTGGLAARGRDAFMSTACVDCHTIRGTPAAGELGPDLTHFGNRRTLAAGMYPNTRGYLEAWIVDAQSLKPGNLMPSVNEFDGETLRALAAYLESLR